MIYLDTSALLAFTLTKTLEPERFAATARLFDLINTGQVRAVTSFYALHELFSALHDATDLPHAIAAHAASCSTLVGYDEHFRAISHIIAYKTPEEFVAEFSPPSDQP